MLFSNLFSRKNNSIYVAVESILLKETVRNSEYVSCIDSSIDYTEATYITKRD